MSATQPAIEKALRQAGALAENGETSQAEHIYRAILRRFPDNQEALDGLLGLGGDVAGRPHGLTHEQANAILSLYNQGRLSEALKHTAPLAAQNPSVAFLHGLLGAIHLGLGHPQQALSAYRRAAALTPDLAEAHNNLADALLALGQNEEALASLEQAAALAPDHPMVELNTGEALRRLGRHADAVGHYRNAIALKDDMAEAHCGLGRSLTTLGQTHEALACFAEALELRPDYAEAHEGAAAALVKDGKPEQAVSHCLAALETNPDSAEAYNTMGLALDRLGRQDEALASLRHAIDLKPDYPQAHSNLCNILARLERLPELGTAIEQAQTSCLPDDPLILFQMGQKAAREKDNARAREYLEAIDPDEVPEEMKQAVPCLLGRVCDRLGDYTGAFAYFEAANAIHGASEAAQACDPADYRTGLDNLAAAVENSEIAEEGTPDAAASAQRAAPVFLIGFPRSGTHLIESILKAHPQVTLVAHQPLIQRMKRLIGGDISPERLDALGSVELAALAAEYHNAFDAAAGPHAAGAVCIDRHGLNLVETALIHRVFPAAKFVFVLRHPCDCVLSAFMQEFDLDDATANFLDLRDAAKLYEATMRLWFACESHMPLSVHYVRYEDVVAESDIVIPPLLEFLGLDPRFGPKGDDGTLGGPASHYLSTERLYTQASGRWQHYYVPMRPVIPMLESWAQRWGYN